MPESSGRGPPSESGLPTRRRNVAGGPGGPPEGLPPGRGPKIDFSAVLQHLALPRAFLEPSRSILRVLEPSNAGQRRPKLIEHGAQKSFSKILRGWESPWTWPKCGLMGRSRSRSCSCKKGEAGTVSNWRQDIFPSRERYKKAWSSISELLWHGNEGGWGDAFLRLERKRSERRVRFGPKDLLSRDEN